MSETIIEHKIDGSGVVSGFSYHDGYLAGFSVHDDLIVFVVLSTLGDVFNIRVRDVYDFCVSDYWNGAIVSDMKIWNLSTVPISSIDTKSGLGHLYEGRLISNNISVIINKYLKQNANTILFQLDCSYGGRFSCLCAEVQVLRIC